MATETTSIPKANSSATEEAKRLARHFVAPLVATLVAGGFLPEAMQEPAIEGLVIIAAGGIAYGWSWLRAR